ncbi:TRAP transporter small permease [Nioella sp.]|uniref:TRAP transporter small permease n=1 Tax=Nioella sp. TaxID=1912091 RepID=UPI003A8A3B14
MNLETWARASLILAATCFLIGASATVVDVLVRAVANRNLPGVIEITTLSIGLGALLSMPVCYKNDTHVTARLLSELRPGLFLRPLRAFGAVFALIFAGIMAAIMGHFAIGKLGGPETTSDLQIRMDVLLVVVFLTFLAAFLAALVRILRLVRGGQSND